MQARGVLCRLRPQQQRCIWLAPPPHAAADKTPSKAKAKAKASSTPKSAKQPKSAAKGTARDGGEEGTGEKEEVPMVRVEAKPIEVGASMQGQREKRLGGRPVRALRLHRT